MRKKRKSYPYEIIRVRVCRWLKKHHNIKLNPRSEILFILMALERVGYEGEELQLFKNIVETKTPKTRLVYKSIVI